MDKKYEIYIFIMYKEDIVEKAATWNNWSHTLWFTLSTANITKS